MVFCEIPLAGLLAGFRHLQRKLVKLVDIFRGQAWLTLNEMLKTKFESVRVFVISASLDTMGQLYQRLWLSPLLRAGS